MCYVLSVVAIILFFGGNESPRLESPACHVGRHPHTHVHTTSPIRLGTVRSRARRFFARTVIFWHVSIRPSQPCRNVSKCAAIVFSVTYFYKTSSYDQKACFYKRITLAARQQLRNAGRDPVFPLRETPRRRPFSGADAMRRRPS